MNSAAVERSSREPRSSFAVVHTQADRNEVRFALDFAREKREPKVVHVCVLFGIIGKSANDGELIHRKLYVQARIGHSEIGFKVRDGFGDFGA